MSFLLCVSVPAGLSFLPRDRADGEKVHLLLIIKNMGQQEFVTAVAQQPLHLQISPCSPFS